MSTRKAGQGYVMIASRTKGSKAGAGARLQAQSLGGRAESISNGIGPKSRRWEESPPSIWLREKEPKLAIVLFNYAVGLTRVPLGDYLLGSWISMMPAW